METKTDAPTAKAIQYNPDIVSNVLFYSSRNGEIGLAAEVCLQAGFSYQNHIVLSTSSITFQYMYTHPIGVKREVMEQLFTFLESRLGNGNHLTVYLGGILLGSRNNDLLATSFVPDASTATKSSVESSSGNKTVRGLNLICNNSDKLNTITAGIASNPVEDNKTSLKELGFDLKLEVNGLKINVKKSLIAVVLYNIDIFMKEDELYKEELQKNVKTIAVVNQPEKKVNDTKSMTTDDHSASMRIDSNSKELLIEVISPDKFSELNVQKFNAFFNTFLKTKL